MDSEKAPTFDTQEKQPARNCCHKILLVVVLVTAVLACTLSICTLTLQILGLHHYHAAPLHYNAEQEQQLMQEVAQYLHGRENKTSKRVARATGCSSSYDPTLTVKPSAHLAGRSWGASDVPFIDSTLYFQRLNPVLSTGWGCHRGHKSHVLGGMKYNDENGFLKVPVEGIYFIYSQILMNVSSPDSSRPIKLGHMTVHCTCDDRSQLSDDCYCYSMQNTLPYNDDAEGLMRSYSWNMESSGGSTYHGGLFHLTANSYIAIVPVIPDRGNPQLSVIAQTTDSFFGAFYVTGLNPPSPSPTSTPSPSPSP